MMYWMETTLHQTAQGTTPFMETKVMILCKEDQAMT